MPIRILLVDDNEIVRQGLRMYLGTNPDLQIVGEARDGAEAVRLAVQLEPDVVLMDLIMSGMDGIAATRAIRREQPTTEVVAITSVLEEASAATAIAAGAISYLLKNADIGELTQAIEAAASGCVRLSPQSASYLLRQLPLPDKDPSALTPSETEVLRQLAQGKSDAEIAQALHMTVDGVKACINQCLRELGLAGRTHAALYAMQVGLVPNISCA